MQLVAVTYICSAKRPARPIRARYMRIVSTQGTTEVYETFHYQIYNHVAAATV